MTSLDGCPSEPFLDAVALLNANQRHDGRSVEAILADPGVAETTVVLAQMLATAIRSQPMTVEEFCDMQIDKSIEKSGGEW